MELDYGLASHELDDSEDDARADAYCEGFLMHSRGDARPAFPHLSPGWDDAEARKGTRVVVIPRPEGYYHAPIGAFD